jgi:hypothetical protein
MRHEFKKKSFPQKGLTELVKSLAALPLKVSPGPVKTILVFGGAVVLAGKK